MASRWRIISSTSKRRADFFTAAAAAAALRYISFADLGPVCFFAGGLFFSGLSGRPKVPKPITFAISSSSSSSSLVVVCFPPSSDVPSISSSLLDGGSRDRLFFASSSSSSPPPKAAAARIAVDLPMLNLIMIFFVSILLAKRGDANFCKTKLDVKRLHSSIFCC